MNKCVDGKLIPLSEEEIAEIKAYENSNEFKLQQIEDLKNRLKDLDYIGTKIATGRATVEEYADKIALMNKYADEINKLESELN